MAKKKKQKSKSKAKAVSQEAIPKPKSKDLKGKFPYGWFRQGKPYFCRIRIVAHTKNTDCVNKGDGCKNCAVLKAYKPVLREKDWIKIKKLSDNL